MRTSKRRGAAKRKRFFLKRPSRSKGSCEQNCAEQQDDHRAADGAGGPDRVCPGAVRTSELERARLARAERERCERGATVVAVPSAMANVAATPAQKTSCVTAKTSTRIAPVQGLMPTENTTAMTFRQERGPRGAVHRRYDRTPVPARDDGGDRDYDRDGHDYGHGRGDGVVHGMVGRSMLGMTVRKLFFGAMRRGPASPAPQ